MARINYPEDFLNQSILFTKMKTKHDDDGPSSPLIPFLTEHGIDLGADAIATNDAKQQNTDFDEASKKGEDLTQDRDNLFNPVFRNLRNELQFLKSFYVGNPKELGNWGVQVDGNRIVYPPEFLKRTKLFKAVKAQHDSLGMTSPLNPFLNLNNIDMASDLADTTAAENQHAEMLQAKADAEKYSAERNVLFNPVFKNVRAIAQYLKTLFVKNPKKLGDWGYTVDDSPRPPQFRETTIPANSGKTLTGVKLGSQMENTGPVPLQLHKGEDVGMNPFILEPEMRFTVVRGWGTTTVQNPSTTEDGVIGYITTNLG